MRAPTIATGVLAASIAVITIAAQPTTAQEETQPAPLELNAATVDYPGFAELVEEVAPYRAERLVSLAEFSRMAGEPGTVILDTRSAEAFAAGHIAGAVHLNFSDFTADKLARVIPSPDTRILIYCNNNFRDNVDPVTVKSAPLALNLPTYVNLYGYGYYDVFELADLVSMDDENVNWVTPAGQPAG